MKKIVTTFFFLILASLAVFSQPFSTQSQWETYFKNRIQNLDPIEGIWGGTVICKIYQFNNPYSQDQGYINFAVYKSDNIYKTYGIDNNSANLVSFQNSANVGIYIFEYAFIGPLKGKKVQGTATLTGNGLLEYSFAAPSTRGFRAFMEFKCTKLSPKTEDDINNVPQKSQKSSGTGFAISSSGIIVTNFHVIDGANSIIVRGINTDFNKTYKAKTLLSDKNNDLALIQIDDYSFVSLETIPYTIKTGLSEVGENIFVLGYPLRASMGDEIKLTNGIISSRTGYQGDITSYQISAPIQPGNSGGPIFDKQGNLIGIINAKLIGAENASYAVKASYLTNLIDLLPSPPKLQMVNSLSGKSLTQQVELAKRFVYIIETE